MSKLKSSNKSFGIVFFILFTVIAIYPMLNRGSVNILLLLIGLIFLILGILNSKILSPLNLIWVKFGDLLGIFVSPLVMVAIFFLVVTPTGFLMKLLGKDILNLRRNKSKSYWIKKDNVSKRKMKNQF